MITVCMIVKNEESNIIECLTSFRPLTNHFSITDTGSSDKTVEYARQAGAEVSFFAWKDDFSAARNTALSQVKKEWVMMIDADQRLSEEDGRKIRKTLSSLKNDVSVIELYSEFHSKKALLPKLWRTSLGLQYRYPVHEYLQISTGLKRHQLDVVLRSLPKENYLPSRQYYVSLMEEYLQHHSNDQHMLYYLLCDAAYMKDYQKALLAAQRLLELDSLDEGLLVKVLLQSAQVLQAIGSYELAHQSLLQALDEDPQNISACLLMGDLSVDLKNKKQAAIWYQRAQECPPPPIGRWYHDPGQHELAQKKLSALAHLL